MSRTYSKQDPVQIQRAVYDEVSEANRVTMVDTEMEINVSHEDGDSVHTLALAYTLSEGIHQVEGMKTLCLYGEATISVSADDVTYYPLTTVALEPKTICAKYLKIEGAGLVVVQSV